MPSAELNTSLGWKDPLEKRMATHSSILTWRIPWTEQPCGLQFMGSQRVRHDWEKNSFKLNTKFGLEFITYYALAMTFINIKDFMFKVLVNDKHWMNESTISLISWEKEGKWNHFASRQKEELLFSSNPLRFVDCCVKYWTI